MLDLKSYKEIFDSLPTATIVLKVRGGNYHILEANDAYLQMTRSSEEDIIGHNLLNEHLRNILESSDEIIQKLGGSLEKVQDDDNPIKNEVMRCYLVNSNENSSRYWKFAHTPVTNSQGELKYIIQTLQDVTGSLTEKEKKQENTNTLSSRGQLHAQNRTLEDL